jgi:hypothetical protein
MWIYKRSIEESNLLARNEITLDSVRQCILKISKADNNNILAFKFSPPSLPKFFSTWFAYGHSEFKTKKPKLRRIVKAEVNIVIYCKVLGIISTRKGIVQWIDGKSEPFVCLALKHSPQKH